MNKLDDVKAKIREVDTVFAIAKRHDVVFVECDFVISDLHTQVMERYQRKVHLDTGVFICFLSKGMRVAKIESGDSSAK